MERATRVAIRSLGLGSYCTSLELSQGGGLFCSSAVLPRTISLVSSWRHSCTWGSIPPRREDDPMWEEHGEPPLASSLPHGLQKQ